MTGAPHVVSVAMVVAGTAVVVAAMLSALAAPGPFARLHFSAPVTSLGGPLIAIGLSVKDGLGLTTASILIPTAILFFTGPLLSAAVARTLAERDPNIGTGSGEPDDPGADEAHETGRVAAPGAGS